MKEELTSKLNDLQEKLEKTEVYVDYLIEQEQYSFTNMDNKLTEFNTKIHRETLDQERTDQINASYDDYKIAKQDLDSKIDKIDMEDITDQFNSSNYLNEKVDKLYDHCNNILGITNGLDVFHSRTRNSYDLRQLMNGIIDIYPTFKSIYSQHEESLHKYLEIDEEINKQEEKLKEVKEEIKFLVNQQDINKDNSEKDFSDLDYDNMGPGGSDTKKRKRDSDDFDTRGHNKKSKGDTDNSETSNDNNEEKSSGNKQTDWSENLLDKDVPVLPELFRENSKSTEETDNTEASIDNNEQELSRNKETEKSVFLLACAIAIIKSMGGNDSGDGGDGGDDSLD